MTRTISASLSGVLEDLELAQPTLVTSADLRLLIDEHGIKSPVHVVAARLRERGWLLPTARRGVWEFAPAAAAGAYSRHDPLTPLRAFLLQRPQVRCGLTFRAAAWAHGLADRVPARPEVAAVSATVAAQLPAPLAGAVFDPRLDYVTVRDVPVLARESVVVHMAARPTAVRSWASVVEWLPGLARDLEQERVLAEVEGRPTTVRVRLAYLLQALRPDLATALRPTTKPGKTWFGPRGPLRRHDAAWQVADTLLPFSPRDLVPTA